MDKLVKIFILQAHSNFSVKIAVNAVSIIKKVLFYIKDKSYIFRVLEIIYYSI